MITKDEVKNYFSILKWDKLKNIPLTYKSKEYQRMLCGTRVFFGLFAHKRNINLMLFGTIGFAALTLAMWISFISDIKILSEILLSTSYLIILLLLLLISVVTIVIIKHQKFKPLNGIFIFYRERLSSLVLLLFISTLLIALLIDVPLKEKISLIFYILPGFLVFSLLRLLMSLQFGLSAFSLVNYAKENLEKLDLGIYNKIDEEKDNIQLFRAYYLTIYYAYKRIKKFTNSCFGKDVSIFLKINRFPILASQVLFLNDSTKMELLLLLTEFEKKDLIYKQEKFVELMGKIEEKYKDVIPNYNNQYDFDELFHQPTYIYYFKIVLTFLLPIITTIANLYLNMRI